MLGYIETRVQGLAWDRCCLPMRSDAAKNIKAPWYLFQLAGKYFTIISCVLNLTFLFVTRFVHERRVLIVSWLILHPAYNQKRHITLKDD